MITSAVRGVVVTALTTTFALLPTLAHAEQKDEDNDIERVELVGVTRLDTRLTRYVDAGDDWTTHVDLYAASTTGPDKKHAKKPQRAGDAQSSCSAVEVRDDEVTAQCTRVLRLKKGTLTLSDMITYSPPERVTAKTAITGGTGHYRSAYGDGYITLDGHHVHLVLNVDE